MVETVCAYRRVFSRVDEPKDFAGNSLDVMPLSCGDEHQLPELPLCRPFLHCREVK